MQADNLKSCCLVKNNITEEGCKHLENANWRQLSIISSSSNIDTKGQNQIGEEGFSHIIRIIN